MRYRPEIDGLRAFAVVPVLFFHGGIPPFGGGFVGVDIFFVISGFLITTILVQDLEQNRYSIVTFYERRARRILPALFVVLGVTTVFCYFYMLPDELKRFGQSLLATTLFSNNILLTFTSGYWELTSEFKPLLHTWSLGVEEQYYILFPIFLLVGWRLFRKALVLSLVAITIISLLLAEWGIRHHPDATFYLLPTRAWELLLGSIAAFILDARGGKPIGGRYSEALSGLGFLLILGSSIFFTSRTPTPSIYTLAPTAGAALVILFAHEGTFTNKILSWKVFVGIGLVSYSAYLWHNPLFVAARVYSIDTPPWWVFVILMVATFVLSYLSWRFVEQPFRARGVFGRRFIFTASTVGSALLVLVGFYLHHSRGVPSRMYAADDMQFDDMYKSYNRRAFGYKKDSFAECDKLRLLIIGNSFGRDFVNLTLENFDLKNVEMVYRDDYPVCLSQAKPGVQTSLLSQADVIVVSNDWFAPTCAKDDIALAEKNGKTILYAGMKHFGKNLNWLMQLPSNGRANRYNHVPEETLAEEKTMEQTLPAKNMISLMGPIRRGDEIPITDERGRLISPDRVHLTKQGAIYLGTRSLKNSAYPAALAMTPARACPVPAGTTKP